MRVVSLVMLLTTLLGARVAWSGSIPDVAIVEAPGVVCPSSEGLQSALGRLRGGPAAGGGQSFRLFIDRTAEVAHVELRDGTNRSVLVREIPMGGTDCEHAAEAIALIVERHFRAVEWSPGGGAAAGPAPHLSAAPASTAPLPTGVRTALGLPTAPPPLPPAPLAPSPPTSATPSKSPAAAPAPVVAPPPAPPVAMVEPLPTAAPGVAATATTTASPAEHPPLLRFDPAVLPRLALGAGPAFWSRASTFAVALAARWRVAADGPVELGAGVLLPPLHASAAVGSMGSVHVGAVPVTASAGLTEALGRLALVARLGLLWTIERGQSEAIPTPATAWRTVFGVGLGASAAWPLSRRLRVTGSVDGYRTVLGRSYAVSGVPGTVLDPGSWQAVVVLGAEWVVVP